MFFSHGPGVWRLNLALLEDTDTCDTILETINELVEYQRCFPSLHKWWDFLKNSFKDIAQDFGKKKQKQLNYAKVQVTNLLIKAKRDLLADDDSAKTRIEHLESDLQALNWAQNEAVKIRSRVQWLEEGEKLTKYFLRLSQHAMKRIRSKLFIILKVTRLSHNKTSKKLIVTFIENCTLVTPWILKFNKICYPELAFLCLIKILVYASVPYLRMRSPVQFAVYRKGKPLVLMGYLLNFLSNSGINCVPFYCNFIILALHKDLLVHL